MFNQYFNPKNTFGHKLLSNLTRPATGILLTVGLTLTGTFSLQRYAATALTVSSNTLALDSSINSANSGGDDVPLHVQEPEYFPGNGVYLYGQTAERDQVGYAYAVMEVIDNMTVGAFYMPQSSFDCFHGEVQANALELSITPTYGGEEYSYSVPLQVTTTVASVSASSNPVQLSGYHKIEAVSDNDHRILNACRSAIQNH